MDDFDDLAAKVGAEWGMRVTTIPSSELLLLWNKKARLHGIALICNTQAPTDPTLVAIPLVAWNALRGLGDRVVKPTVVFIRAPTKVFYFRSWPTQSGLHYDVIEAAGGAVGVPKKEFAEIKKAETK